MKIRLFTAPLAAALWFAPLAFSQEQAKPDEPKSDAPAVEAQRQGRVALKPNSESPPQSMSQAIAFEKYKERSAAREARKEGRSADRSAETAKPKPAKKQ